MEMKYICGGNTLCPTCMLFNENLCGGCDAEYHKRCLKRSCNEDCNICGGGKRATVPACCGRSPYLPQYMAVFETNVTQYCPPVPKIKSTLIPVFFAQIAKWHIPEYFPNIDCWAVPVHKVMSLQGKFRSADLKDYLGLPKDRKLILSTSAPDDFMEMLWEKMDALDFQAHGVDYWFPAHFSIYDNDSKFYQYYSAKRQQIHMQRVKSQFAWFRLGENIPVSFLTAIHGIKAILISCQQMYTRQSQEILRREIELADGWFPPSTSFFLIGRGGLVDLKTDRPVFRINARWIMLALKGRVIGDQPVPHLSIQELLIKNLEEVCNEDPVGR